MKTITKREKLIYTTFIALLLALLLLSTISDVYARYSSAMSGSGNIELAEKFMNTQIETDTIKIYTDDTYETMIDMKNNVLKGKLNESETKVITLYWKWVPNADVDQLIAENYDGFTITANVTGEQTTISENENVEMKIENKI